MYCPPKRSTARPNASKSLERSNVPRGAMITALPPPAFRTGQSILVGHGAGEPQGVPHRIILGCVVPNSATSCRRPEMRRMDGNDRAEPACLIVKQMDTLVENHKRDWKKSSLGNSAGIQKSSHKHGAIFCLSFLY